jgi:hypothetical protein
MSESLLRLRVDSQEYDANIRKAAEGIQYLAKRIHDTQGEFAGIDKDALDFIKNLQYMNTKASTATGQYRELSNAYKNLAATYNGLNAFEKQGEAGKALASQLDVLKKRTLDMKANIDTATQSLEGNSQATLGGVDSLKSLTSAFGINITKLASWGTAIATAKGALDVATDALMASEANVDDWGRTVAGCESLYQGFLNALNNGDISGYLSHIDDIVKAAHEAYNELDRLGTMKTIQSPKISAQQTENERMRMMIQTGRYIAPVDGRKSAMKDGQLLSKDQIKNLEKHLQSGMQSIVHLHSNEVKQTGRAIDAYYNKLAKENGISLKEFHKGTSSMAEFDKRMAGYDKYLKFEKDHSRTITTQTSVGAMTTTVRDAARNPYAQYRNWGNFRVDKQGKDSYNELVGLIKQRDQQASQVYGMQSQAYRSINRAEGVTVAKIMGRGGGGSTHTAATPQGRATNKVNEAERTYSETMQKASVRFEKGLDDTLTFKKKELSAQERLFDAYSDAYNTYKSPAIKKKQEEAADEIGKLSAEVKKETDAQKNAQEAARKLEAEQKKAAEALAKRTALEESWKTPTVSSIASLTQDITTRRNESAIGSAEFNSLSANLVDITSLNSIINASLENGINIDPAVTQSIMQQIVSGTDIDDSVWTDLESTINTHLAELGLDPIKLDFKTGNLKKEAKGVEEGFESAAGAIQAVGSAMSQVEDPAVKVMGIVAEAIATIALTFAKSLKGTITPWDWIAAAAAGTSTMIGVISAIHSSTGYANGGMIKGNTYSGDQLMAQGPDGGLIGLNAGEIVLNKAAQGNLASQLNDNSNATPRLMAEVSAEQIRFVIRNNRRRENISETALFR